MTPEEINAERQAALDMADEGIDMDELMN